MSVNKVSNQHLLFQSHLEDCIKMRTVFEGDKAIKKNDKCLLSKHLYLVWSISNNDYWFRHHLETKNSELKSISTAKDSKRYYRFKSVGALLGLNPIKARLNHLGEITKIGEY